VLSLTKVTQVYQQAMAQRSLYPLQSGEYKQTGYPNISQLARQIIDSLFDHCEYVDAQISKNMKYE
jgi:hypothetical protein